jgi:hypothetical protein
MDADLQHPPEVIERLAANAREQRVGVGLIAASRFGADGVGSFGAVPQRACSRPSDRTT